MLRRINRLLFGLALLATGAYIVTINPDPATLRLGKESVYTASTGVLSLILFCAGVILATLASGWWTMRSVWRERRALAREKQQLSNLELIVRARGLIAAKEFSRAKNLLSGLVRREPKNSLARIELSRALEGSDDLKAALEVLDLARRDQPHTDEVLIRAAEIQRQVGNRVAALDLYDLVLTSSVSQFVLESARDVANELGDSKRALSYHSRLVEVGYDKKRFEIERAQIAYEVLKLDYSTSQMEAPASQISSQFEGSTTWEEQVLQFLKRFPKCVPALIEAAKLSSNRNDHDATAALLTRAAQASSDPNDWRLLTQFWIEQRQPERAIAVARSAADSLIGTARVDAELELARVLMHFSMSDDAEAVLAEFDRTLVEAQTAWTTELRQRFVLLQALLALQRRDAPQAQARLQKLITVSNTGTESVTTTTIGNLAPKALVINGHPPALSTP